MKIKTLSLTPQEADLVRSVDFDGLAPLVKQLKLPDATEDPRPIRIRLPRALATLLQEMSESTGVPQLRLLIKAAKEYRSRNPHEKGWREPGPEHGNAEEDLIPRTLRLRAPDRELIRNLGRGVKTVPNRRAAFEQLIPILGEMRGDLSATPSIVRVSVKLRLSDELVDAIERQASKGHSFSRVLVYAAEAAVNALDD